MYEIIYTAQAENCIKSFIQSYKNVLLETYTDTGIFYEDLIKQNYIDNAEKFYLEIIDNIEEEFIVENILGCKSIIDGKYQKVIVIGSFRLFINFKENTTKNIRYIGDIQFYKR